MTVRSSAQCRRTVPRKAVAPHAGIWVTDSMLRQAIERYHRRSFAPCRSISSHSGPLESRRRLGKRHMTGIMPSSSTFPPIWQFEMASIPGVWKWEPPTTPDQRRERKQGLSVPGLFDHFIGWLEKSDTDKPFIRPPLDDVATVQASAAEAMAFNEAKEEITLSEITEQEVSEPTELPKEIVKLRTSISLLDKIDDDTLHHLCKTCRRSLRRRVERGHLSVEGLLLALEPFDQETKSRIPDPKTANRFAAMIRRSILSSMEAVQSTSPSASLQQLWIAFTAKVCAANGSNHDIQMFWRLICTMPDAVRAEIASDQLFAITRSFAIAQSTRHNLFAHWSARAARFGDALSRLSPAQRVNLESDMKAFLSQGGLPSKMTRRMRLSWLMVKAYDASTTTQPFIHLYQDVISRHNVRPNSVQLWQVMVGRLKSIGALERDQHSKLIEFEYPSLPQRWTSLVFAALSSKSPDAGLSELCICLKGMGEMETLTQSLTTTATPIHRLQIDAVRAVAIASGDHRLAFQLYESLDTGPKTAGMLKKQWDWTAWITYVERIIKDPELEPQRIWQILNLAQKDTSTSDDPVKAAKEIKAKMDLLDQMGQWYMETSHLNDRQVFRYLEWCVTAQRSLTQGVSSQTLANLTNVVTRDLDKGEMGRTTRLGWLVEMIAKTHDTQQAEQALSALRGWRWMIDRVRRNSS